jgi:hypothetical protein
VRTYYAVILSSFTLLFAEGIKTYYNYYENFNYESPTALSSQTGAYLFDFVPLNLDELDVKARYILSFSTFIKKIGDGYGNDVNSSENVDLLKNFCFLFNYQREFMPFISYSTPYKSVLDYDDRREIIKKRDAVSVGIVSDLRKHQVGLSLDALMSTYSDRQINNGGEYHFRRGGFSARMTVNVKMNNRSSMLLSVVSPVFLDFDIDDNYDGKDRSYFDRFQSSTGFNYRYKNFFATYSLVYRNNEVFYDDDDGRQLTYSWLIEHNFIAGYAVDKNVRFSLDYQLLPSIFTEYMPYIGDKFRHTIGAFASVNFGSFTLNARYADSEMFSDENLGRIYFQTDLIYTYK